MKTRPPCMECGARSRHDHHVIPRALGGTATVPLCVACHRRAHAIGINPHALHSVAMKEARSTPATRMLAWRLSFLPKRTFRALIAHQTRLAHGKARAPRHAGDIAIGRSLQRFRSPEGVGFRQIEIRRLLSMTPDVTCQIAAIPVGAYGGERTQPHA